MDLLVVLFLGISLALDCFAVSLSAASHGQGKRLGLGLVLGSCFGVSQAGMLLAGSFAGYFMVDLISGFDHWVAFGILLAVGLKMICEGVKGNGEGGEKNFFSLGTLIALSVATSIDALGVGLSLALIAESILVVALAAGVVSFLFSVVGALLGGRLAERFGNRFEVIGGLILIVIGTRILLEHAAAF